MGRYKEITVHLGNNLSELVQTVECLKNSYCIYVRIEGVEDLNEVSDSLNNDGIDTLEICNSVFVKVNELTKEKLCFFHSFLFSLDAEMVLWYFSKNQSGFISSMKLWKSTELSQRNLITTKICDIIVSWVTNEYQMYVHYNPEHISENKLLELLVKGEDV